MTTQNSVGTVSEFSGLGYVIYVLGFVLVFFSCTLFY